MSPIQKYQIESPICSYNVEIWENVNDYYYLIYTADMEDLLICKIFHEYLQLLQERQKIEEGISLSDEYLDVFV